MKRNAIKHIIFSLLTMIILMGVMSCGQKSWSKRGYRKGWIKSDTIINTIYIKESKSDTIFKNHIVRDTVIIKDNKLTVRYFYNTKDSTVYLDGKCDPDTIRVPVIINAVQEIEQTKWQKFWTEFKDMILYLLIALLVLAVIFRLGK